MVLSSSRGHLSTAGHPTGILLSALRSAMFRTSWHRCCGCAGMGGAAKWKEKMLARSSAIFSRRGADLQRYIYSSSALAGAAGKVFLPPLFHLSLAGPPRVWPLLDPLHRLACAAVIVLLAWFCLSRTCSRC